MCDIAEVWATSEQESVEIIMNTLIYRNPYARGIFIAPNSSVIIGHQRLSIIETKGGDRPIYSLDQEKAIIGNGEIYNYSQL